MLAGIVVPENNFLITMIFITMIWCSEQFWLFKVGQYDEGQKKNIQWNWSCVQTRKEKSRNIVIVISHEQWALIFQTVIPWEDSNSEQEMVWTLNKKLACDAFATVKYWYAIVTVKHCDRETLSYQYVLPGMLLIKNLCMLPRLTFIPNLETIL